MSVLIVVLAGGIAGGLWLVATALVPAWRPDPEVAALRWRRWRRTLSPTARADRDQRRFRRILVSGAAGGLVVLYLRVPAAGVLVAAVVWIAPTLTSGAAEADEAIRRLEALGDWTRRIADLLSTGSGLEQAMQASLASCPPPVAAEVGMLVARLNARWSTEDALHAFASDLVRADEIVGALILAAGTHRGAGLRRALMGLAEATEARVRSRRDVEADRAKPRSGARSVLLIIAGSMGVVLLAGRHFLAPYRGVTGEIVLLADSGLFLVALLWMRALSRSPAVARLLPDAAGPAAASRVGGRPAPTPRASLGAGSERP